MTIYLPDELAEEVKAHNDLNVSAVCQEALRRELATRAALAVHDAEMKKIKISAEPADHSHEARDLVFTGKSVAVLYGHGRHDDTVAYLTKGHRLLVEADGQYWIFDDFDDFANTWAEPGGSGLEPANAAFVADVAEAIGEEHVLELDI